MSDQAAGLRRLADEVRQDIRSALASRARRTGLRLLAVASGKGGVGKTNLAVNLALAFAEQGQPVLLVDADLGLANADLLLGLEPRCHLGHVLQGQASLGDALLHGPLGLRLLPGGTALEDLAVVAPPRVLSLLAQLTEAAPTGDLVLLDVGAGLSPLVRALLGAVPEVLVVTTPEPTSVADAYATMKVLARESLTTAVHLVVNQAEGLAEARDTSRTLARVARRYLGIAVTELGYVPRDPCVPRAVRDKRPFLLACPRSPASRAVRELALRLGGGGPAAFRTSGWGEFLTRFLRGMLGTSGDEQPAATEAPEG